MAYSTQNPPRIILNAGIASGGPNVWLYQSTDPHGTVD
jgi:hypothetical protein